MNIQYKIVGSKSTKKIYLRMYKGKFDLSVSTGLIVMDWDALNECSFLDNVLNETLQCLKLEALKAYNLSLSKGGVINSNWLNIVIKTAFSRPKFENNLINDDYTIYLSDFADFWMKNHSGAWKTSARKVMSKVLISQYKKFVSYFSDYEKTLDAKIQLKSFSQEQIYEFIDYMREDEYSISTCGRVLGRLRFFMNRADEMSLEVSKEYKRNIFFEDEEELDGIYLNESEIKAIFDLDLSHDELLDSVRDNLLISCWTSLRISDFMTNLKIDNIKKDIISIKTQKTGSWVKLPIHTQVKSILSKRFGQLPSKITHSEYNRLLKIVCQLSNIDNVIYGKLFDSKLKRKTIGYRPKYSYVSSHIGRRSFISNLRGKISDNALASFGGWTTTKLLDTYDQTSKLTHINTLKQLWEQ